MRTMIALLVALSLTNAAAAQTAFEKAQWLVAHLRNNGIHKSVCTAIVHRLSCEQSYRMWHGLKDGGEAVVSMGDSDPNNILTIELEGWLTISTPVGALETWGYRTGHIMFQDNRLFVAASPHALMKINGMYISPSLKELEARFLTVLHEVYFDARARQDALKQ